MGWNFCGLGRGWWVCFACGSNINHFWTGQLWQIKYSHKFFILLLSCSLYPLSLSWALWLLRVWQEWHVKKLGTSSSVLKDSLLNANHHAVRKQKQALRNVHTWGRTEFPSRQPRLYTFIRHGNRSSSPTDTIGPSWWHTDQRCARYRTPPTFFTQKVSSNIKFIFQAVKF